MMKFKAKFLKENDNQNIDFQITIRYQLFFFCNNSYMYSIVINLGQISVDHLDQIRFI